MSPPFIFQIDEIEETNTATFHRVDSRGNWIPSTEPGASTRINAGVTGRLWFCDRQTIREIGQLPTPGCQVYKTFSVYYAGGAGFWILRGDATAPLRDENWHPLRFEHSLADYSSYLTNAGEQTTLRTQRNDQRWPAMLLPDIYHTPDRSPSQQYGGLTGELPIFLALMALSTPREFLHTVLQAVFIGGAWREHGYAFTRAPQRGVVVTVYTAPSSWSGGSTSDDLEDYELGHVGKYFY